jgi:hypothetical protein
MQQKLDNLENTQSNTTGTLVRINQAIETLNLNNNLISQPTLPSSINNLNSQEILASTNAIVHATPQQ